MNSLPSTLPTELPTDTVSGELDSVPPGVELPGNSNELRRRITTRASENTSTERTNGDQFSDEDDKDRVRVVAESIELIEEPPEGTLLLRDEHESSETDL